MGKKKILIVDEESFGRVCDALLRLSGFRTERLENLEGLATFADFQDCGLLITSYPYGAVLLDQVRDLTVPLLVLSDFVNSELIEKLNEKKNSYFMVKPIDFNNFNNFINSMMRG